MAEKNYKPKLCQFTGCQREFTPKQSTSRYCGAVHEIDCIKGCGEKVFGTTLSKWNPLCRNCRVKQASQKRRETTIERYGVSHVSQLEEVKERKKERAIDSYGVENISQASAIKEKKRQASLSAYGTENISQAESIKEKKKETLLRNYGVDNPHKDPAIKKKIRETSIERYGGTLFESPVIARKIRQTNEELYNGIGMGGSIREKIEATNLERLGVTNPFYSTAIQSKIAKVLQEKYEAGLIRHSRISKVNMRWAGILEEKLRMDVDFEPILSESKTADLSIGGILIDINPTFTHNARQSFSCFFSNCRKLPCEKHPVDPMRHFSRSKIALDYDLSYIQIYDWDTPDAVIRLLRGKLEKGWERHSARKLEFKKIQPRELNRFLNEEHIQGTLRGQEYCYGLFSGNLLIAGASFGKNRFRKDGTMEWLRYAVRSGHIVRGGAGRLWKEFLKEADPSKVISYIDFNHTTRKETFLSSISGWEEKAPTGPTKVWSSRGEKIYQNSLMRLGINRLLKTSYGSREECGMGNEELMLLEGWLPIFTAGNRVFEWKKAEENSLI